MTAWQNCLAKFSPTWNVVQSTATAWNTSHHPKRGFMAFGKCCRGEMQAA
ncbi:hypothetical protein [Kingella kingae]|nr:hypothetical protein [Kingella kingae]